LKSCVRAGEIIDYYLIYPPIGEHLLLSTFAKALADKRRRTGAQIISLARTLIVALFPLPLVRASCTYHCSSINCNSFAALSLTRIPKLRDELNKANLTALIKINILVN